MSSTRTTLHILFKVMGALLFVSTLATFVIVIVGSAAGSTTCRCRIDDTKRRYIDNLFQTSDTEPQCVLEATCICLCEDSEVPQCATIESPCKEEVVLHNEKTAYHFRAFVVYSWYTWDNSPPEAFSVLFLSLIFVCLFMVIFSAFGMIVVAKEMVNLPQPPRKEEGVYVPHRAVAEA